MDNGGYDFRSVSDNSPLSNFHYPLALLGFAILCGFEPALARGVGESIDQVAAVFPADASIGDTLAVDEWFPGEQILSSGFEVAFDHEAENAWVAGGDLPGHVLADAHLFGRLFAAVAMAAIDHDARGYTGFGQTLGRRIDVGGVVVGLIAAAQDNVAVLVAQG